MQEVRGLIYFENKTVDDIKEVFDKFKLDNIKYSYFSSLSRHGKDIPSPGLFLTGDVKDTYSSKDIVGLLRKKIGLSTDLNGCDISIENEDTLKQIIKGNPAKNYIGIRINAPYNIENIYALATEIGEITSATDIFVRTVESDDNERPIICIDLITDEIFEKHKTEVEKLIISKNLSLGKYTYLSFI